MENESTNWTDIDVQFLQYSGVRENVKNIYGIRGSL